jgi:hypothetical protein
MRKLCIALALALAPLSPALAWNHFGHMVVAAAAWDQLTPAARAHVMKLLALNPSYKEWRAQDGADPDETAFLLAATWPDDIKKPEAGYKQDGEHPSGPQAAANIGYADKLQHRYWHFIDMPFSPDHTPLIQPESPNALTQIVTFARALSSDAGDDLKSYDLVWLEHLVGDVHQPLHTASRFTVLQPKGDEGGNKVSLCDKPHCRDELHAQWDELLGKSNKPEDAMKYARKLPAADRAEAGISDPQAWVKESFEIAAHQVYLSPIGDGPGPYKLDDTYRAAARKIAQQQAALAGARLAKLLNSHLN